MLVAFGFRVPRFPSVPFYPFSFWVPLLKPNSRKKGTLIIKGLLGNLGSGDVRGVGFRVLGTVRVISPCSLGFNLGGLGLFRIQGLGISTDC